QTAFDLVHSTGYWTLLDGTKVIPLEVLYSDRGTAEIKVEQFLAKIDSDFTFPSDTPNHGSYIADPDVYIPTGIINPDDIATMGHGTGGVLTLHGTPGDDVIN